MDDDLDMGWLNDIEPAKPDPRLTTLRAALAEWRDAPPNVFMRSVVIDEHRFLVVGTWSGERDGKVARINGAPGTAKSFLAASELVELDLREEHPAGEHRVWLLSHALGMPLKFWLNIDNRDAGQIHYVLTEDAWRKVTPTEYAAARSAWS